MRTRTAWMIGGAASAALVTVCAVALLVPRAQSAQDVTRAYLRALESGDAGVLSTLGVEISEDTASAFRGARAHITEARVTAVVESGDEATAKASFLLEEAPHEVTLDLVQDAGRWVLDPDSALGQLHLTGTPSGFATVGDTMLPTNDPLVLVPAAYELSASPVALLDGASEAQLLPGAVIDITLKTTILPQGVIAAQEQLDEHLVDCTAPDSAVPEHCGIRLPWAADLSAVSSIRYRVEKAPSLTVTESEFRADGGVLVATVSGTGLDGAERSVTYRTQDWALRGDVGFTVDDIVLSAW